MLKHIITLIIFLTSTTMTHAQTSRRTVERFASEAAKQMAITGRMSTLDILDSLANNAETSVEMLSRMSNIDDAIQPRTCLKLIDAIVDYSQTETGRKYTDVVRTGLKKALDRSYEPEVQLHVLEQLARCAKPADAQHIAMYLEMPELAPTAQRILVGMSGIDNNIAEAAASQPGIKAKVQEILDIHAGKKPAATVAASPKPKPAAQPFWTSTLERIVDDKAGKAPDKTNSIIINNNPEKAMELLLQLADNSDTTSRNDIIARFLKIADKPATSSTNELRYLLLRHADELTTDDNLRQRLIIALGETQTVQALAYISKYYGKPNLADALAVASTDIISANPDFNNGPLASRLLYNAKQSYIRHYDEEGADTRIDQTLAAIDNWHANGGYNFAHTETTRMEKRGFWIIHDELSDYDLAFDWLADGQLTLSLRSMPALTFDRSRGVMVTGDNAWHKFSACTDWATANVSVRGNTVTVYVNGHKVIDKAKIFNPEAGEAAPKSGFTKFLADDNGAIVRQYCYIKK